MFEQLNVIQEIINVSISTLFYYEFLNLYAC